MEFRKQAEEWTKETMRRYEGLVSRNLDMYDLLMLAYCVGAQQNQTRVNQDLRKVISEISERKLECPPSIEGSVTPS